MPGIPIDRFVMVGAGAVLTQSVPDGTVVVGNPANIIHYVGGGNERHPADQAPQGRARDG